MRTAVRLGWLEIKLLIREPLTLVFSLALPLIVLLILGGVFGNTASAPGQPVFYRGVGPMSYYVPAYLCLVIASVCVISIPTHLAGYRERGVLKRYRAASLGIGVIAGSELIVAFALSAASSVILLIAARLVYTFDAPSSLLGVILVFCYLTVGFTAMGLLLGGLGPDGTGRAGCRPADLVRDVDGGGRRTAAGGVDRRHGLRVGCDPALVRRSDHAPAVARARSRNVLVGVHRCRRHQREPRLAALSMGIGSPSTARSALRIIGCVRGTVRAPAAPSWVKTGSADRVLGQRGRG